MNFRLISYENDKANACTLTLNLTSRKLIIYNLKTFLCNGNGRSKKFGTAMFFLKWKYYGGQLVWVLSTKQQGTPTSVLNSDIRTVFITTPEDINPLVNACPICTHKLFNVFLFFLIRTININFFFNFFYLIVFNSNIRLACVVSDSNIIEWLDFLNNICI